MQLTPREFDKLIIHMMAEVALKRKAGGIKLNYPEAVAIISARALEVARAGNDLIGVGRQGTLVEALRHGKRLGVAQQHVEQAQRLDVPPRDHQA